VKVIVHNTTEERFTINEGDRVAQLVIERVKDVGVKEVKTLSSQTKRGRGGFGVLEKLEIAINFFFISQQT
jgi:dUTP pyrophosphatase